jgi:hypothetical protein
VEPCIWRLCVCEFEDERKSDIRVAAEQDSYAISPG